MAWLSLSFSAALQAVLTPDRHLTKACISGAIASSANLEGALLAENQK